MKSLSKIAACLAVVSIALFGLKSNGEGETNYWIGSVSNADIDWCTQAMALVIGPVTIYADGNIKLDDRVSLDDAARDFWKAVYAAYPVMFTDKAPTWK